MDEEVDEVLLGEEGLHWEGYAAFIVLRERLRYEDEDAVLRLVGSRIEQLRDKVEAERRMTEFTAQNLANTA